MDSEDSRDSSSGSDSNDAAVDGSQSPDSVKSHEANSHAGSNPGSSLSHSRSSSPSSRTPSIISRQSRDTPQSPDNINRSGSPEPLSRSRSQSRSSYFSEENGDDELKSSRLQAVKIAENVCHRYPLIHAESPRSPVLSTKMSADSPRRSPHSPLEAVKSPIRPKPSEMATVGSSRFVPRLPKSPEITKQSAGEFVQSPRSIDTDINSSECVHVPKSVSPVSGCENADHKTVLCTSPKSSNSSCSSSPTSLRVAFKSVTSDNFSVKSASSYSSRKSTSSRSSNKSGSSRGSRKSRRKSDDDSSDSSESSIDSSSRKNKNITKAADTQPEEISDGDIESDHEKELGTKNENNIARPEINIAHEDLSDVSDLEESLGENSDSEKPNVNIENPKSTSKATGDKISPEVKKVSENANRPEEVEEQLDFEAEDGECAEIENNKENDEIDEKFAKKEDSDKTENKKEEREELEEGEVTDEDDIRPEETEPRPVCRFFSRGQCTWGASCRFLHPGVTDKGNYTMFELIRPVVPGEFGRDERMLYGKPEPPLIESAWERGLRTAKEMLRKSVKRKEQDIDFEEKKMNLSLAQEEFDKENGYYGRVPSPEPRFVRHIPAEYPVARPPPEEYYGRRQVMYESEYDPPPTRERARPYRELPSHRMPDYYNNKYDEEPTSSNKRARPKREVIVQRSEERQGRGDEWSDPWMRSKSPAGRRKERKRSYSSGSSYSSSSSSRSSSDSSRSSYRSRSRSSHHRRRSRSRKSRHVSPSVIVSERKAANERAALMNPPAPKRRIPSPGMMRVSTAANPPAPLRDDIGRTRSKLAVAAALVARVKGRRSSRSSSGSSGSSSTESDSSDSSSSSSRDGSPPVRRPAGVDISLVKAMDALKGGALEKNKIKLNLKNPVGVKKPDLELTRKVEPTQNKKRPANSPPSGDPKSKKATSRREELLKQLKAVEDAIAKKRSKVN